MKKKVLIIVPFEETFLTTNGGIQLYLKIIGQFTINFKLTLIISQSKAEFLKYLGNYKEIQKCDIYSIQETNLVQTFSRILPSKLENNLRYCWYNTTINEPTNDNFLKLYQLLVRLLFRNKYNAIIINNPNLSLVNLVRKFDNEVAIIYVLDYQADSRKIRWQRNSSMKKVNVVVSYNRKNFEFLYKLNDKQKVGLAPNNSDPNCKFYLAERVEESKVTKNIHKKSILERKGWKIIDTSLLDYINSLPAINYYKRNFKIHFLTFASESLKKTLERIRQEAESSGFFDTISCMRESDLPFLYRSENKSILSENIRGFGYWIWKSYITKLKLEEIDTGDILVYMDVGCSINLEGEKRFYEYVDMLVKSKYSNLAFQLYQSEKMYSKGDLFKYFDVEKNKAIKNSGQLIAGVFFIRKDMNSQKLVDEWYSICHYKKDLINDSDSIYPNDPSFIEHRHDQSIFSLLRKLKGSLIIKDETWFSNWNENKHLPIHARRLKKITEPPR